MSLEQALVANTAAVTALHTFLASHPALVGAPAQAAAPSYPPPAPAPQAPPAAPAAPVAPPMPTQPFPAAPAAPQGLPFNDNVSAAAWATNAWQQMAAVNPDVAQAKFGALMASLGAADFNQLTPDKYVPLFQGVQAIKAELGIPG